MNKDRRIRISTLREQLNEIQAAIADLHEEEECAFENLPEGIQQTERGAKMEAAATALEDAGQSIEEALDNLEAATA